MRSPVPIALLLLGLTVLCSPLGAATTTALDAYVAASEPNYGYVHAATRTGRGYTVFALHLTSLSWRAPSEVNRTTWSHDLLITVPWVLHSGNHQLRPRRERPLG